MALEDLIARLERDAEARAAGLEAAADAEASALLAEAGKVAAEVSERELNSRRAQRRAQMDAALAEARRLARGALLEAQHALLARMLARARELVPEVGRSAEYLAELPRHWAEARRFLEGVQVVVRCQPALVALLRSGADAQVTFVEDASLPPGVVVTAADDSVFIDNTLPARLQRLEARLAVELLASVASDVPLSPGGRGSGRGLTP
jgi:vacuolar-type H+-ATPase subunit E/Vma4